MTGIHHGMFITHGTVRIGGIAMLTDIITGIISRFTQEVTDLYKRIHTVASVQIGDHIHILQADVMLVPLPKDLVTDYPAQLPEELKHHLQEFVTMARGIFSEQVLIRLLQIILLQPDQHQLQV